MKTRRSIIIFILIFCISIISYAKWYNGMILGIRPLFFSNINYDYLNNKNYSYEGIKDGNLIIPAIRPTIGLDIFVSLKEKPLKNKIFYQPEFNYSWFNMKGVWLNTERNVYHDYLSIEINVILNNMKLKPFIGIGYSNSRWFIDNGIVDNDHNGISKVVVSGHGYYGKIGLNIIPSSTKYLINVFIARHDEYYGSIIEDPTEEGKLFKIISLRGAPVISSFQLCLSLGYKI